MFISQVRLRNYRSCRDVTVTLQPDVTVLAGENNAGKSSVVDALRVLTEPFGRRANSLAHRCGHYRWWSHVPSGCNAR